MKKLKKVKLKKSGNGTAGGGTFRMKELADGYVPRDCTYPLSGKGFHDKKDCEEV